jgi:hypothetical protein
VASDGRPKGGGGAWNPESAPLEHTLKLLPTPTATEYGHNKGLNPRAEKRPSLAGLTKLLPTPTAADGQRMSKNYGRGNLTVVGAVGSTGPSTDQPSSAGKTSTVLRLSPSFVEWMIGAPAGWSDPDCPLSATEFRSKSEGSPAPTSSSSKPDALPKRG